MLPRTWFVAIISYAEGGFARDFIHVSARRQNARVLYLIFGCIKRTHGVRAHLIVRYTRLEHVCVLK